MSFGKRARIQGRGGVRWRKGGKGRGSETNKAKGGDGSKGLS